MGWDSSMTGLKLHLVQNITKRHKVPSPPLPPLALLPSPLLCPHHTFLASLILASMSNRDHCYSNKAWTNLSDLPPHGIGWCKRALIDALKWHLLVGKFPADTASTALSNHPVGWSKSDGELVFVYNSTKSLVEMQYQQWTLWHSLNLWLSTSLLLVNMLFSVSIVYCHFTHVHHYSLYK